MLADLNPYAAPQATLTWVPTAELVASDAPGLPWRLVRQGLRNGTLAGLMASLAMLFVFVLRSDTETKGGLAELLTICAVFTLVTSGMGLFWGLNHAVIVWCLEPWQPGEDNPIR
jgi:hypothetical protein